MIRKAFFFAIGLFALAICAAGFFYGKYIPFAQQWPLFEALRNTAAIIFAVVGAWLAIIYPERLRLSFGQRANGVESNGNVNLLLTPAIHSTIILVALLLIGIVAPILKQISIILTHVALFRSLSFLILCILTLWQIAIVVVATFPADIVKTIADSDIAKANERNRRTSLLKKEK